MASAASSDSGTLIPSSPDDAAAFDEHVVGIDTGDHPVKFANFRRNVQRCKALMTLTLPAAVAAQAVHLHFDWTGHDNEDWGRQERQQAVATRFLDIFGLVLTTLSFVLYLSSLLLPISDPSDHAYARRVRFHRNWTTSVFLVLSLLLVAHDVPGVAYTVFTHRAPPVPLLPIKLGLLGLSRTRSAALVIAIINVGSMRRGPRLRYTPLKLSTGFGLTASATKADKLDDAVSKALAEKDVPNVLDWSNSSLLSFVFFFYIAPLARRSANVPKLLMSDLPYLEAKIRTSGFRYAIFSESSRGAIKLQDGPLPRAPKPKKLLSEWQLFYMTWKGRGMIVFFALLLETTLTALSYVQIAAVHQIITSFDEPRGSDKSYAHLMCWALFLGQAVELFLGGYAALREYYLLRMPVRMAVASMLFAKILRTTDAAAVEANHSSDEEVEAGKGRSQVMNLLTRDTGTIASLASLTWDLTNSFIGIVIGVYFLYSMLGVSALVGLACMPLAAPASVWAVRNMYRCDRSWSRAGDSRLAAIKEFLLGIKVIKLNAFEESFQRNITRLRDREVVWQRWRFTISTLFNILAEQLPLLAILVTFLFHTKFMHRTLEPATAFVALGVFNRVRGALSSLPSAVNALIDARVSLGRLCAYLNQAEIQTTIWDTSDLRISIQDATIGWPMGDSAAENLNAFKLRDLTVDIPTHKFTLVCGALGSGKTLLLRSLLGEAMVESGSLQAPRSLLDATPLDGYSTEDKWTNETWLDHSVAYAPQQAYIRHGTVRDNVLFGQPFWRERYCEALRQSALVSDLSIMQDGDMTEVGEHGVGLSGGQKARVNLARCLYSRAKTVYMDDILSAVDAHTAQFIIKECLSRGLLQGRTCVLVTHHVRLCLPIADFIIALNKGKIDRAGPASDFRTATSLLSHSEEINTGEMEVEVDARKQLDEKMENEARHQYAEEHQATGRVAGDHYLMVLAAAGGLWYWILLLVLYFVARGFDVWQALWLRRWSADPDERHLDLNLGVYAALVTGGVLSGAARWVWLYGVGNVGFYNRGSRKIHCDLLRKICDAPLAFFEQTPAGRLMNIFGHDMDVMDALVADYFGRTLTSVLEVVSSVVIVSLSAPYMVIVLAIFCIPLYFGSGYLRKLRADLRRLDAIARSPLITLYHDAIEGVVMCRAFGTGALMSATMHSLVNRERQATLSGYAVSYWVCAIIRTLASVLVTATGFYLVHTDMSASQAGFILTFALAASQGLYGLFEYLVSLEQTFVSAERINQYMSMPLGEPKGGEVPPPTWPENGDIEFRDVCIRYADDLPDVLHKISLKIEAGHRVGLVGATGSGKSTLALSLFRAMEAHEGEILIDGKKTSSLNLRDLRGRLNMVTQDGNLSSGSLREALDITRTKDDYEIYDALRRVHLIPTNASDEELKDNPFADLDTFVAVEGANFSHGQRQLLCLARALLKQSRILVMDEATSSVDFETDTKITQAIKECFEGTTMLVIAHRLATIINYDRVLVLDRGKILEYGKPSELMSQSDSAFHELCAAQGPEEFERLRDLAQGKME